MTYLLTEKRGHLSLAILSNLAIPCSLLLTRRTLWRDMREPELVEQEGTMTMMKMTSHLEGEMIIEAVQILIGMVMDPVVTEDLILPITVHLEDMAEIQVEAALVDTVEVLEEDHLEAVAREDWDHLEAIQELDNVLLTATTALPSKPT